MEEKRNNETKKYMLAVVLLSCTFSVSIISFSLIVYAQPVPHNIAGRVFTNDTNGVQNGIPIGINNTATGVGVSTQVFAPPIPQLRGSYSATITGTDGDLIYAKAWNDTHWGENESTLVTGTTFINIILNKTRDSEGNVTILTPQNHTLANQSIPFNVTANITMLGNTGTNCNATISFSNGSVLNITEFENITRAFTTFPLSEHRMVNWTVVGIASGTSNISVDLSCESDGIQIARLSNASVFNVTVQNLPPTIESIVVDNPFDLVIGDNTTFFCNATIIDFNGLNDIVEINATLFQSSVGFDAPDDNNNHFTNSSCVNISNSDSQIDYACGFKLPYYANNGTWNCSITVEDTSNPSVTNTTTTIINELLAITIDQTVVDYGELAISQISPEDVNLTISNAGNVGFNISVHGFAREEGDNISMACEKGNITHSNQKYMITPETAFDQMINLTNETTPIINITFPQRTNDITRGNDTNNTYWKMQVPALISGACNGSLVFSTRIV